jgi:AcrR family transcriptional regulator
VTVEATPTVRKSDRTRQAILGAARVHFAARGFDGANLRAISADASIDPAMVMRYFGSKEGLFAAAVQVDLQLPPLSDVPEADRGQVLTAHFVRRWEGDLSDNDLVLLLRSAVTNEKVSEQLRTIFTSQVVGSLEAVVPGSELLRRAALVSSQMLGLALTRYILALPGTVEQPADLLIADVAPTVQRYLHGPLTQA